MPIQPDTSVNYRNFGFIPTGHTLKDIKGKLWGQANLYKRLQAEAVMTALDIKADDTVLDFGCGCGYFTMEMAKQAAMAHGLEVLPLEWMKMPDGYEKKLEFTQGSGLEPPYGDEQFDVILASEVLPMIPDPRDFGKQLYRMLKSGGRLVVVNGAGHPLLKKAFKEKPFWFKRLAERYPDRMPLTYEEYCRIIQQRAGTSQDHFLEAPEVQQILTDVGFTVSQVTYSPGKLAYGYFTLNQFIAYLRNKQVFGQAFFPLKYGILRLLDKFDNTGYSGGLIMIAYKR